MTHKRHCRAGRGQRRGVFLVLAVVLMAAVAGLVSLLALNSAHRYREHQADRVRRVAVALVDSGAVYARSHLSEWAANPPSGAIYLDVDPMLDEKMTGVLSLTFVKIDDRRVCRVSAEVRRNRYAGTDAVEIDLGADSPPEPVGTRPAATP